MFAAAEPTRIWVPLDCAALLGYGLLAILVLEVLIVLFEPLQRWRLRHIPGPPALPVVGCMKQIKAVGSPRFFQQCYEKYGPVFKIPQGREWTVVVVDPNLVRKVGSRLRSRSINQPSLMLGHFREIDKAVLPQCTGDFWRMLRTAWEPAFFPARLSGYFPRMVDCAVQLVERLERRAVEGGRVNIWRELGSMTLQVVGSTAYGVDFLAMDDNAAELNQGDGKPTSAAVAVRAAAASYGGDGGQSSATNYGRELMLACGDYMRYISPFFGSRYIRGAMLLPELRVPLALLAHAAPDEPFKRLLKARATLRNTCITLIRAWEAQQQQQQQQQQKQQQEQQKQQQEKAVVSDGIPPPATATATATAAAAPPAADNDVAVTAPARKRGTAVEPGSFLGLMLSARDKGTGAALTDDQVAAQAQTLFLAGYETSAGSLTFSLYCIAINPEAERKLLMEIDEVLGPDRAPTEADLPRLLYTEAVFYEAMRLYPPAYSTTRLVEPDAIEVGGYTIPAGTPVILAIYSAHHDPRVWPRAEEFIPERFLPDSPLYPEVCARVPHAHSPFGFGVRICIGWRFVVQEAKVALARIYQRLRFQLEPGQVPLKTAAALTLAPKDAVWVRPVARRPPQQ